MQLKDKPRKIADLLAVATSSLLGSVSHAANLTQDWDVDTAVLYYKERDRVTVVEPVATLHKTLDNEETLDIKVVIDSLTGASPNGAVAQSIPQTFSTPSGESTYTAAANETPLDTSFKDTRAAASVLWEKPLNRLLKRTLGINFSREYDYTSVGLLTTFAQDNASRLTTWTTTLSTNFDFVHPVGGIPESFSQVPTTAIKKNTDTDSDDKLVLDGLIGVTQVLSRHSLLQVNFNIGLDKGYLTDPYKIISIADDPGSYVFEKRPDSRSRYVLYGKWVHALANQNVFHGSYRYYVDSWDVVSHTFDIRYRIDFAESHYIQPHYRYYLQEKADFYNFQLASNPVTARTDASADYRLADMSTTSVGIKYGRVFNETSEWSARIEHIHQQSEGEANFDDVDAIVLQMGFSFHY